MGVQIQGDTGNVIATKGTFSGDVGIAGTLTYEDVTNIDSVGLVTARNGIEIGARPGVAASISVDGNMIISGISTFGDDVKINVDSKKILLGAGADLEVFHNGTNSHLRTQTGDLIIDNNSGGAVRIRPKIGEEGVVCTTDGSTALYHDGTKKFETSSSGVTISGDTSTGSYLKGVTRFTPNDSTTVKVMWDETGFSGAGHFQVKDGVAFTAGDSSDLKIYHNGSDSLITDTGTGSLALGGSAVFIQNVAHNANMASFVAGAEANLFYNGTKTFETQNGGVKVTGDLTFASNGNALDFQNQTIDSTSNYNRTVTGEKLDYYEEGYLDPTAISAGLTFDTSGNRQLRYVRIGHWVSVSGYLDVSSYTSNSNAIQVAMPYTSAPNSSGYYTRGVGAVMYRYINLSTNYDQLIAYVGGGENYMRFFQSRSSSGDWLNLVNSNLASTSAAIYFSVNYMVA